MSKDTASKDIGTEPTQMKPVDKVRRLGQEAKQKREQEEAELQAQKTKDYQELQEHLQTAIETLEARRQELKEVQDGLNEIVDIEKDGIMTDDLKQLRTELEESKKILEDKINEDESAIKELKADPLYVEMAAVKAAANVEAQRVEAQERESQRKQEEREKIQRTLENLDTLIVEISSAIEVAKKRESDIRAVRAKKEELQKRMEGLAESIETDIGAFLYALPEKQQRAIATAVTSALESGVAMFRSRITGDHIAFRPSANTMSAWFEAWREKVTPSVIPFTDRPLRALLAFEGDERLDQFRKQQELKQKLTDEETALFADRGETNVKFIENFLAPDSTASTLDFDALSALRHTNDEHKDEVIHKLRKLNDLRNNFDLLLSSVGDPHYRQYDQSQFKRSYLG